MDTNVMPDSVVPIMPNATTYHGDSRLARKKAVVDSPFWLVTKETANRRQKYPAMMPRIKRGDMASVTPVLGKGAQKYRKDAVLSVLLEKLP
jgi:hypothetical protein